MDRKLPVSLTPYYRLSGLSSSSLPPPPPPPPPSSSFKASLHHSNFRRDDIAQPERTRSSPSMYAGMYLSHASISPYHLNGTPDPFLPFLHLKQPLPKLMYLVIPVAQDHAPPPPPPPFSGRAMLPPSPQHNARASLSRIPPPPLPFSSGRDLPIVFTTNRTAGSMSILSMLGSDPGMPPREPITVQRMNATSPTDSYSSPTPQTVAAASPTRSNPSNEFLQQHPSEKRHSSQAPSNRPVRTYSGEIQYRPYATAKASSPDGPIHGPLSALSNSKSSPRSDANAPHESKLQHNRHSSVGGIISRPSSQPNGYVNPLLDTEKRRAEREARRVAVAKQDDENVQQASHDRVPSFEFMSRQAQLERQRRLEQERIEQEKQAAAQNTPRDDRNSGLNYPFLTQSSVFSEPTCSDSRPETESYVSRLAELRSHNKSSVSKEPFSEDALRCMREQRQRDQQSMSQPLSFTQPRSLDNMDERRIHYHPQNTILGQTRQDITGSVDGHNHQNRVDDVVQSHRTMLGLLNDNKRPGRVSPLPQAVQGAQEQKRGPSSDPIIKNEFSRMFAGIGSGVGSTGMNSGTSTPFPPSPKPESERRITFTGSDALARNGSRIGKRARKPRYDEPKGPEIVDVRATTGSVGAKGIKRSKNGTHHHGHVHVHQ